MQPEQPLNQGIGGGPPSPSVLSAPVQAGAGSMVVTTSVDDPHEIVGPFEAPAGAVALIFALNFVSSTSMPAEGLMAAADDLTAEVEIGQEQITGLGPNFAGQWTISLPAGCTKMQVRLGIYDLPSNPGTNVTLDWTATWI